MNEFTKCAGKNKKRLLLNTVYAKANGMGKEVMTKIKMRQMETNLLLHR